MSSTASSASALESPSTSTTPTPSPFLLTLQIIRLVNAFRNRAKTRARSRSKPERKVHQGSCQGFERQVATRIDKYLCRKAVKLGSLTGPSQPEKDIERSFTKIKVSVTFANHDLNVVAKDSCLFLQRKAAFTVQHLSICTLTELSVSVRDLLDTLRRASICKRGARTLCEGNELLDLDIVETANLEHLLLCLLDQLVRLLIAYCVDCVQRHVNDCQKDQIKHCEEWFFEFPDVRHPLSTTWPWNIRPSLAVLWGVCWMFYDFIPRFDVYGNMVDVQGNTIVPQRAVQQWRAYLRQVHQPRTSSYSPASNNPTLRLCEQPVMTPGIPRLASGSSEGQDFSQPRCLTHHFQARATSPLLSHASHSSSESQLHLGCSTPLTGAADHIARTAPISPGNTNILHHATAGTAPRSAVEWNSPLGVWSATPQAAFRPNSQDNTHAVASRFWPLPPHSSAQLPDFGYATLPQRARNPESPSIRLDPAFSGVSSATRELRNCPMPLSEESTYYAAPYSTNLSTQEPQRFFMAQDSQSMNTPVSPVSAQHSPRDTMGEQMSRKRSHSQMRDEGPLPSERHSRSGSAASLMQHDNSDLADEYQSPRGSRTFKRAEAPTNSENKYYCDFSAECEGLTFDRKCEWSKHMDKHDRPYRCQHPSCAKLQGFTYSGGLLRHEREVHGKHGGPKTQLICPYPDCKRHSGKGFTRKENLNEHIRRVHNSKSQISQQPSQSQVDHIFKVDSLQQAAQGAEQISELMGEPTQESVRMYPDAHEDPDFSQTPPGIVGSKRKRETSAELSDVEALQQEVKRLRASNAEKDDRLTRMEAAEALQQAQMQRLENMVRQLSEQLQQHQYSQQNGQIVAQGGEQQHIQHQDEMGI